MVDLLQTIRLPHAVHGEVADGGISTLLSSPDAVGCNLEELGLRENFPVYLLCVGVVVASLS
jgi:hypothetical protein